MLDWIVVINIPNMKNSGTKDNKAELAPVTLPVFAAATVLAIVGTRFTPTKITIKFTNICPNIVKF